MSGKIAFLVVFVIGSVMLDKSFATTDDRSSVCKFIEAVKTKDASVIAERIRFPLNRPHPIPPIANPPAFVDRFSQVFDEKLIGMIAGSDIEKDWDRVGSQGIMFSGGDLWLGNDGRVIAINYESVAETELKARLLARQRSHLHKSLREFSKPILDWETVGQQRIRIDQMEDGSFRYASWPAGNGVDTEPDLVLSGGEIEYMGSGGNHVYRFRGVEYVYEVHVIALGTESSPPGRLLVRLAEGAILLNQDVVKIH